MSGPQKISKTVLSPTALEAVSYKRFITEQMELVNSHGLVSIKANGGVGSYHGQGYVL